MDPFSEVGEILGELPLPNGLQELVTFDMGSRPSGWRLAVALHCAVCCLSRGEPCFLGGVPNPTPVLLVVAATGLVRGKLEERLRELTRLGTASSGLGTMRDRPWHEQR